MYRSRQYIPNLIADMAECDANYIRLRRLFPAMDEQDQLTFGVDAGINKANLAATECNAATHSNHAGVVVSIRVIKRYRYTTILSIRARSNDDKPWIKWPCLEVRVYRDVKSAEVTSFEQHRNFKFRYTLPNPRMYQPDEKSQINKFLGELLGYLYAHGHSLDVVTAPSREPL